MFPFGIQLLCSFYFQRVANSIWKWNDHHDDMQRKSLIRDKMEILNAFPLAVIVDCLMECYAHKIHTYKDKAGKVLQKMGSLLNAWTDQKIHGESVRYILAVRHEEKTLLTFLQEISLFDSIWYCYTKSVSEWESLWKLFRDTWFIFHLGT